MFALAARAMGYRVHVFAPDREGPASQVADKFVCASYDNLDALREFSRGVSVVTYEFENVPAAAVQAIEAIAPVRPSGAFLFLSQDRVREKRALAKLGLPVAPYAVLESDDDLAAAKAIGAPSILKTASSGYDGKGQRRVDRVEDLESKWGELGRTRAVLEGFVPFVSELSVVGARALDGTVELFDPVHNEHVNHILDVSTVPAGLEASVERKAHDLARAVLVGLDVVGVACVELFLLEYGGLVVNEIAPRPHNSGHLTLDGNETSQFEQQVRAICGLPLGSVARLRPATVMVNLLGHLWEGGEPNWAAALADPGVRLHLYGKETPKVGRKMGHLTVLDESAGAARERALLARTRLGRS
ncbi:MAG: 5-(carboxyamino)imidazole ribonucleotide synthase [Planctomycetota bacterium]|jgi:5-(carboxyamino)imidazole ribonucleotide synthase